MNKWSETELNKIGNVVSGGTPSTSNSDYWNGGILFVTPYDLSRNETPYLNDTERKISNKGLENSSATLVPAGSIVISSRAPIGYIAIGSIDFTTNQGCKSIIPNSEFDSLFLYYCFHFYVERIKKLGAGSTFAEISKKDLESVKFPHPTNKKEQQKISYILNTADTVIEKTQAAIAKYKAIKQGMLHDLFTRGIDLQTGKLRPKYEDAQELYKESRLGWIPKEWDVMPVSDVSENLDGKRIPVKQEERDKQAKIYRYYGASGIIDYVENYIFDEPLILLGEDGENVVSRNLPLAFKVNGKIWVNNHAHVLKPIDGITTIDFLCEALEAVDYTSIVSGSAQPKITQQQLNKILLAIPKIEEQEFIAQRLSAIDNKLNAEQRYLVKLKQIKAGLMGDLLSGKKEVKITDKEEVFHG